jgi:hypothetical protein
MEYAFLLLGILLSSSPSFLNVHAPCKDIYDDRKDDFYEELQCALNQFPEYHMKILLGYLCKGLVNADDINLFG